MSELKMYNATDKREAKTAVVKSSVHKKGIVDRLKKNISEMEHVSLKEYIFDDVIIPGIFSLVSDIITNTTNTISDAITDTTDIVLWGEKRKKKKTHCGKVSYNSIYDDRKKKRSRDDDDKVEWDDVRFDTRRDAETVRDLMLEQLDEAPDVGVSIADYLEWSGHKESVDFTDESYGWYKLPDDIPITKVRNKYVLTLPKPRRLN